MGNIKKSSGNIFEDMGFDNPTDELLKANLTAHISALLQEKKIRQKDAARILNVDQPKVSALKNGRYAGFSVERLLDLLLSLEQDIDIIIKPRDSSGRHGEIHVFAAH
jgi:predicted XRE-type DNA-binding protein